MPLVQPFRGLRPVTEKAFDVVAPPYDVLNTAEARERVKGHPLSFLHISNPCMPGRTRSRIIKSGFSFFRKSKSSFESGTPFVLKPFS